MIDRPWVSLALAVAMLYAATAVRGGEPDDVRRAALAAWESASRSVNAMRLELTIEWNRSPAGKASRLERRDRINLAFSPDGESFFYETDDFDDSGKVKTQPTELKLTNSQYKATLQRLPEKKDWILTELVQPAPVTPHERRGNVCPWLVCGNLLLPDLLADEGFVATRVERDLPSAPPAAVRLHFKFDESRKKSSAQAVNRGVHTGYLDMDASRKYCVVGYRYERRSRFSQSVEIGTFQYEGEAAGLPVLKSVTVETPEHKSEKFGSQTSRENYTYKIVYQVDIPETEYRLSHYGLPEPVGVTWKRPTPPYVWLLLAAGVATALAVAFRFLARRSAPRA